MLPAELGDWTTAFLGGLSAFADAVLGVGILVPGEVVVTGLAVTVRGAEVVPFVVLVTLGASLGDHLNYGLGRAFGPRLAGSRVVGALGVRHWVRGVNHLDRNGPRAIVFTRLVPVVRTLVPAIAGVSGLPYRRFLPASLVGSLLWASTWVLAGNVVSLVLTEAGLVSAFGAVVLAGLGLRLRRGHVSSSRSRSRSSGHGRRRCEDATCPIPRVTEGEAASSRQQRRDMTGEWRMRVFVALMRCRTEGLS